MSTLKSTEDTGQNIDGFVNFVLQQIEGDAQLGQEMLKLGTKTKFAQIVELIAVNPFQFTIESIKRNHQELLKLVDGYMTGFFKAKIDVIEKIFKYQTVTGINYFLILNEDSTENREIFFDLLDHYETLNINNILPINISFLPKEAAGKLDFLQELELA